MASLFAGQGDAPVGEHFDVTNTVSTTDGRNFEIGERIRAGGNGVVHRCVDFASGIEYAIKFQLDLRTSRLRRFHREQLLLTGLMHDHLMSYEGLGKIAGTRITKRGKVVDRKSVSLPFIVMPLARCNLFESVKRDEVSKEIYFGQFRGLAHALGVLHQKAVHRDIKPENILVVGERWVISDYGLCDPYDCPPEERLTPNWEIVGPRFWMSPEANNRSVGSTEPINSASDVFQLASVFWFVVNRSHPTGVLRKSDWKGPDALFDPIFRALHYDRSVRPTDGKVFARMIDAAILS